MWIRLWMFLLSVSALAAMLSACDEDALPHRCGPIPKMGCQKDWIEELSGNAAASQDAGTITVTKPEQDSGTRDASQEQDDFMADEQCGAPNRFFAPGCAHVSWTGSPDVDAVQIAPGCYRPCARSYDPICGYGTRCGRVAFGAKACHDLDCTTVCAETWVCLSLDRFVMTDFGIDEDAGVRDEDAGWGWD